MTLGPANLALTGELADGWIGNSFFTDTASVFFDQIDVGAQSSVCGERAIALRQPPGCRSRSASAS